MSTENEQENVMLTKLDAWLMDEKFQKFTDVLHDRFGLSNFMLAQLCYAATAASLWIPRERLHDMRQFLELGAYVALTLAVLSGIPEGFRRFTKTPGLMNSCRVEYAKYRKTLLVTAILLTAIALLSKLTGAAEYQSAYIGWPILGFWLFVVGLYFYCCTTNPRAPKKITPRISIVSHGA